MEDNNNTNTNPKEEMSAASGSPALEKALENLAKAKNDYLYLHAEFDNYRKNAIKERSQYLKYANERMAVELLSVYDNFERALQAFNGASEDPFFKGMELIRSQLKTVFEQFGITEVPSEGKVFDPAVHEALSSEESETIESGHITKVFRRAYKLHDKLIRPAQVVVATKKQTPTPS